MQVLKGWSPMASLFAPHLKSEAAAGHHKEPPKWKSVCLVVAALMYVCGDWCGCGLWVPHSHMLPRCLPGLLSHLHCCFRAQFMLLLASLCPLPLP